MRSRVQETSQSKSNGGSKKAYLHCDRFIRSQFIKVIVGKGEQRGTLYVYKDMITQRSRLFNAALSGRWSNSDSREIDLSHLNPNLFA
jgi:hypothetical protein